MLGRRRRGGGDAQVAVRKLWWGRLGLTWGGIAKFGRVRGAKTVEALFHGQTDVVLEKHNVVQ
jgi:hypothetical protein